MSTLKQLLEEKIMERRPKLGISSVKTYLSILTSLYKNMQGTDDSINWFSDNHKSILEYLEDKNKQTKKTILSALFVLTGKEEYRSVMMEVMKSVNDTYKEQKKNEKQTENWISTEDITAKYDDLLKKAVLMLSSRAIMDESVMMEFLLVAFLGGVNMPPRRSLDYALMKIRNYDTKKDNYYKANKMYFNVYKTDSTYGLQVLDVPKELNVILKKWIEMSKNDYMLYSSNGNKLSSPQITRILNKVFDKKISTSMLRHIYLTNAYKDVPALNKMEILAQDMGHSVKTAMEYIKR